MCQTKVTNRRKKHIRLNSVIPEKHLFLGPRGAEFAIVRGVDLNLYAEYFTRTPLLYNSNRHAIVRNSQPMIVFLSCEMYICL
jgi:hypothetical protein